MLSASSVFGSLLSNVLSFLTLVSSQVQVKSAFIPCTSPQVQSLKIQASCTVWICRKILSFQFSKFVSTAIFQHNRRNRNYSFQEKEVGKVKFSRVFARTLIFLNDTQRLTAKAPSSLITELQSVCSSAPSCLTQLPMAVPPAKNGTCLKEVHGVIHTRHTLCV